MQMQKLVRFTLGIEKRKTSHSWGMGVGAWPLGARALWKHWEVPAQRFLQLVGTMESSWSFEEQKRRGSLSTLPCLALSQGHQEIQKRESQGSGEVCKSSPKWGTWLIW